MPVALFARREDRLQDVRQRIESAGGRAIVVPGDAASPEDNLRLLDEAEAAFGPIFAAYANAGYGAETPTLDTPIDDTRRMFEVNFFGSLHLLRPAIERMRAHGTGHALVCSSCLSKLGLPRYAAYSATKACQDHYGRALRHELKAEHIAVSTVHPVGTKTEFFDRAHERSPGGLRLTDRAASPFMQTPEKVARAIVRRLRKGRGGEIWTSPLARLGFGAAVICPGLTDRILARMYAKRLSSSDQPPR